MSDYLFTSDRLGFRNWRADDVELMALINRDPAVMKFFPGTLSFNETEDMITRFSKSFIDLGYTYFATEELKSGSLIGFIGLKYQDFVLPYTPYTDIGWRLGKDFWGKGLATEGANRCLEFGFKTIGLKEIYSSAPKINLNSIKVMKKLGMSWVEDFDHPLLEEHARLKTCSLFRIRPNEKFAMEILIAIKQSGFMAF